jgi:hypothetical protein
MHEVSADGTLVIAAFTGLMLVHFLFMRALSLLAPAPPPGQSTGAANLIAQAGFVEG